MKRNQPVILLWLLLALAVLAGCGSNTPAEDTPPAGEADAPPQQETAEGSPTLEELLGEDYAAYLTETITMQMENRM